MSCADAEVPDRCGRWNLLLPTASLLLTFRDNVGLVGCREDDLEFDADDAEEDDPEEFRESTFRPLFDLRLFFISGDHVRSGVLLALGAVTNIAGGL